MSKVEIKVPMPGVFYRRPAPESEPFKADGDAIAGDEVVGLVEVMKYLYEIKSPGAGTALRFIVEDAEPVMAGQTIAEFEG